MKQILITGFFTETHTRRVEVTDEEYAALQLAAAENGGLCHPEDYDLELALFEAWGEEENTEHVDIHDVTWEDVKQNESGGAT